MALKFSGGRAEAALKHHLSARHPNDKKKCSFDCALRVCQEYGSLLTAHLEHNERCLRVLEVGEAD